MLPFSRYCSISPFREEYPLAEKSLVIVESDERIVSSAPFSCSPEHKHSIAIRLMEFLNLPFLFLPSILLYHVRPHLAPDVPINRKAYKIIYHFLIQNHKTIRSKLSLPLLTMKPRANNREQTNSTQFS
jgi:hypothetical protein